MQDAETRIVDLVNDFRASHNLPRLGRNARLTETASDFAIYMARVGTLEHDADGSTPAARAKRHGYDYCVVAENIAYEYSSRGYTAEALARSFVQGWLDSPSHRTNMQEPHVVETGVAIAPGPRAHEYYAVQLFGRPASQKVRFSIANQSRETVRYSYREKSYRIPPNHTRTHEGCLPGELMVKGASGSGTIRTVNGARYSVRGAEGGRVGLQVDRD